MRDGARVPAAALGAVAVGAALVACGPAAPGHPDLVLVTIDTLRADRLGCYGYRRDTSPEIDRLAAEALLFENAIAQVATTLPSHVTLLTGTYPSTHGIRGNLDALGVAVDGEEGPRTLAQMLKGLGYETAAFVSATPVKRATGIAAGFDSWSEPAGKERRAGETVDEALEWLEGPRGSPFFLWVHVFDPHDSYAPPPPFDSLFQADRAQQAFLRENAYTHWDHPQIQKVNDLYDGEIRYTDTEIGRLIARLRERDGFARTALVLTADHGEGMGQHDWVVHDLLWGEQIRVPLIVRLPGKRAPAGRVDGLVGLVDVLPTLFGALGLPVEGAAQLEGHDVLVGRQREFVLSERARGRPEKVGPGEEYCLTGERWKYFHATEAPDRLYDLENDPRETRDVLAGHPDVAAAMRAELLARVVPGAAREGEAPALPPEHVEQLRGLGYVD